MRAVAFSDPARVHEIGDPVQEQVHIGGRVPLQTTRKGRSADLIPDHLGPPELSAVASSHTAPRASPTAMADYARANDHGNTPPTSAPKASQAS
jgi:hypothetical protein